MAHLIMYIMSGVISLIYTYFATNKYSVELVLLCSAICVQLFYSIIGYKTIVNDYKILLKHKFIYLKMLIATFILWWLTMYITNFVSPTFFELAFTLTGTLIATYLEYKTAKTRLNLYTLISLIILYGIICHFLYDNFNIYKTCWIFLCLILLGISSVTYSHTSVQMSKKLKLSTFSILATRFWLTIIVLFIYHITNEKIYINHLLTTEFYAHILFLSIIMFIIPLYCYQKALIKLGANKTIILMGTSPILVFIGEYFDNLGSVTNNTLLFTAIAMFIIILVYHFGEKSK